MPGNLQAAVPTTVLPKGLCAAYEQTRLYEANVNEYPNGESQREVRVNSARRRWEQTRKLKPAQLIELITFVADRKGATEPFYMYDPAESTPYGNYDATGVSTNGRFTVRFDGAFSFTLQLGRGEATMTLVEVA